MEDIEFEPPETSVCECCGKTTTRLTRFVHKNDNAYAVYFVQFTEQHAPREAFVMVGLGEWGEDEVDPEQVRVAFTYKIWLGETSYNLSIIDADASPWNTNYLGKRLSKDEALAHDRLQDVFDLSDHMTRCDEDVIAFLNPTYAS
jgi:hypothetical protein